MTSPYLSERQQEELDKSVVQYVADALAADPKHQALLDTLVQQFGCGKDYAEFHASTSQEGDTQLPLHYLEKKWSTVLNLQKHIYSLEKELEAQKNIVAEYDSLLQNGVGDTINKTRDKYVWMPRNTRATLRYQSGSITAVAIHPFKPLLATAGQDGTIVLWNLLDLSEPEKVIRNAHSRRINSLAFQGLSPKEASSMVLASASSDLTVKLWDLASKTYKVPLRTLSGHEHIVSGVLFSKRDPSVLVTCSRDKTIKVWDVNSGWCSKTIRGHSDWVRGLDMTRRGDEYILTCSNDQSVRLTHLASGTAVGLCIGHEQVVEDVVFLPSEAIDEKPTDLPYKYCASCSRDNSIDIWLLPMADMSSGTPRPGPDPRGKLVFQINGHSTWVRKLAVHPNGNFLASCSDDKTIKLWDLRMLGLAIRQGRPSIDPAAVLKGHESFVNVIKFADAVLPPEYDKFAFSDDEKERLKGKKLLSQSMRCYLVSGGADGEVKVWV